MDHIRTEQELLRLQELHELRELGIDPYPAAEFPVSHSIETLRQLWAENPENEALRKVLLAGRVMNTRIMGKAAFAELQDETGTLQIYLRRDDLCPNEDKTLYNKVFKKLTSIGDIIGVEGFLFTTETGELSLHTQEFRLLSKAIRPLPQRKEKDGQVYAEAFSDPELRYRMRYVDLILHPEVRETFRKRSRIIAEMRRFMEQAGYLEVETPILQAVHGGAAARPFETYHNTLEMPLFLRIANELYLKRLIVGGFEGVFEFAKDFRNEGMSRFHNPEFTLLELYVAYKDYFWMMEFVEQMLEAVASAALGSTEVQVGEHQVSFAAPYPRMSILEAIERATGFNLEGKSEEELRKICAELDIPVTEDMGQGKLIDEIFGEKVEPTLIQPTFITDYPIEMSPLAKKHREEPGLVERFELICNGKELANAYSELNDPLDQRQRFEEQLALKARGDEEAMAMDEDFVRALEYGMPPTSGLGIGIDRLIMTLTGQSSIQDVLLFPQQRPEKAPDVAPKTAFLQLGIPPEWLPLVIKEGVRHPHQLQGRQAGQLYKALAAWQRKLKLALPELSRQDVEQWIANAPAPPEEAAEN